jgi:hypothetical protein
MGKLVVGVLLVRKVCNGVKFNKGTVIKIVLE